MSTAIKIRVITDSASDLVPPYRQEVTVLPMTVTFGTEEFQDGIDLNHRQFYEKLIEGEDLPTTSQISPAQFEEAFSQAVEAGETVVAVVLSSKLSGTYQSACMAAGEFPGRVFVVDSENATIGERILVERALQLVDEGLEASAIAARLDREKGDIRLVALLDTLEYLKRGGRVSASVALVGGLLAIKPVVAVREGEVVVLGKARGSGVDFTRPYKLGYAGLDDGLLQKYIQDSAKLWEGSVDALPIGMVGGTIGTHVGPGAIAVAFFQKR